MPVGISINDCMWGRGLNVYLNHYGMSVEYEERGGGGP